MLFYLALLMELFVLFFTSKYLIQALYAIFYKISKNHRVAGHGVFVIFFPGVIIHELAHLLTAELLMVRTGEFEVAPRIEGSSLRMGSVQVAKSDIVRSALIGVAPVLLGTAVLVAILFFFVRTVPYESLLSGANPVIGLIVLWAVFLVTNTMFSSKRDLEGVAGLAVAISFVLAIVAIMLIILKIDFLAIILPLLQSKLLIEGVKSISLLLIVPVVINIAVVLLARLIVKKIY